MNNKVPLSNVPQITLFRTHGTEITKSQGEPIHNQSSLGFNTEVSFRKYHSLQIHTSATFPKYHFPVGVPPSDTGFSMGTSWTAGLRSSGPDAGKLILAFGFSVWIIPMGSNRYGIFAWNETKIPVWNGNFRFVSGPCEYHC